MARSPDPTARIALLGAAEAVFAAHGMAAAKVEEIARRAGVSKGAFYLHFESKEDALRAVCESFLARCGALVARACETEELPDDEAELLAFCLDHDTELFEFFWQNRATLAILEGCQGPHAYLLDAFRRDVQTRTAQWLDAMKAVGAVRHDVDSELTSTLVCGAYHELLHKMLTSPKKPPIRRWLSETQATIFRGLGTPSFSAAVAATSSPEPVGHTSVRPRGRS